MYVRITSIGDDVATIRTVDKKEGAFESIGSAGRLGSSTVTQDSAIAIQLATLQDRSVSVPLHSSPSRS